MDRVESPTLELAHEQTLADDSVFLPGSIPLGNKHNRQLFSVRWCGCNKTKSGSQREPNSRKVRTGSTLAKLLANRITATQSSSVGGSQTKPSGRLSNKARSLSQDLARPVMIKIFIGPQPLERHGWSITVATKQPFQRETFGQLSFAGQFHGHVTDQEREAVAWRGPSEPTEDLRQTPEG